jgi:hypothetical protein
MQDAVKPSGQPAPAEPAGGRALSARERGLEPRGVDASSQSSVGEDAASGASRAIGGPRIRFEILEAFAETRASAGQ